MYRKNVSGQYVGFVAINATTGATMTGTTGFAAYRVLDGGAQASATGTVTDKGNGQFSFALSQADSNGNDCSILFTMTGMVAVEKTFVTTAADPTDVVRFGLTSLPNALAEASGGLYTRGTGPGQINQPANGQIDANAVKISGTVQTARDLGASVLLSAGTGTGQINLSAGKVPATLAAADIAAGALNGKGDWNTTTPPTASANAIATWNLARSGNTASGSFGEAANAIVAVDAFTAGTAQAGASTTITLASDAPSFTIPTGNGGFQIVLISGTGVGQQATITAYNTSTKVATIGGTWKTTPDSTTVYRVYYLTATTADNVLDELVADHTITGSAGKALSYLTGDAYVRLASPVTIDLSQTGLTPRDLGSVADASLTVGDALVAAISGATGKETVVSTTYTVKTPYTGTVIRTFTLDSATTPSSRT